MENANIEENASSNGEAEGDEKSGNPQSSNSSKPSLTPTPTPAPPKPKPTTIDDAELDALLNDALQDFGKLPPKPKPKPPQSQAGRLPGGVPQIPSSGGGGPFGNIGFPIPGMGDGDMNQVWTEEFIKEATAQFEKKMREYLQTPQGSDNSPTSSTAKPETLHKVVEAATKAAVGNVVEPAAVTSQINEALKNFNPPGGLLGDNSEFNEDELAKLMSSFAMGGAGDAEGSEMEELLPFMTNFMEKLLSKDLLYPVLSDIVDRYPEWLADNRQKLSNDEFDKYNRQYEYMKKICEEYASETESDSADTKRQRFDKISELMLKVQCCGSPPKDLVGEDGGGFPGFDPTAAAMAGMPGGDQCSIV